MFLSCWDMNEEKNVSREKVLKSLERLTKEAGVKYVRCYGAKKDGNE